MQSHHASNLMTDEQTKQFSKFNFLPGKKDNTPEKKSWLYSWITSYPVVMWFNFTCCGGGGTIFMIMKHSKVH